jgi:hypothetical protein
VSRRTFAEKFREPNQILRELVRRIRTKAGVEPKHLLVIIE